MGPKMDPKWGQNSLEINWKFGFEMDSEWSQSGAKMEPKWSQKASQNRAKTEHAEQAEQAARLAGWEGCAG